MLLYLSRFLVMLGFYWIIGRRYKEREGGRKRRLTKLKRLIMKDRAERIAASAKLVEQQRKQLAEQAESSLCATDQAGASLFLSFDPCRTPDYPGMCAPYVAFFRGVKMTGLGGIFCAIISLRNLKCVSR